MSTAKATTDESGSLHSLTVFIGKPIPMRDLLSNSNHDEVVWDLLGNPKEKDTLNDLRYGLKGYFATAALDLIENKSYRAYEPIRRYRDKKRGVFAIHCYERNTVTIVNGSSKYRTISDDKFLRDFEGEK